jgi:hypothetical protein
MIKKAKKISKKSKKVGESGCKWMINIVKL